MLRSQKRLLTLVGALPLLIVAAALLYMLGMSYLEQQPRSFWRALAWSAETLSTTGYGADHTWDSPWMVIMVIVFQFIGVFLVFLIFPIYLIPVLEERFEARLPKDVPAMDDHVVVYRFGPPVATLLGELRRAGVKTVVVEDDPGQARRLVEKGYRVLFGGLEDNVLRRAHLLDARSFIANGTDDENAGAILAVRQLGFEGDVLALVEEPFHRKPIMLSGATDTYTPRHVLGAALAARASRKVSPAVAGAQLLGRKLRVSEMRITPGSQLIGRSLSEADLGKRTGVTVIGQWVGGRLVAPVTPDMRLEQDGILILLGSDDSLERFETLCGGMRRLRRQGPFVVAGYGEVGQKVVDLLGDVGEETLVIDKVEQNGVSVVGSVLDPRVLEQVDLSEAQAAILALDTDSATLFTTVILKDLVPELPVIARVNQAENVERIHRAGAEFALSISQVSGQILARRLLGEESIAVDAHLKVLKVSAQGLEDHHPAELGIRERTGCSVVAVERGDDLLVEFGDDFRFAADDAVYVCGSSEATHAYAEEFARA